jgi:hypothetical protein
MVTEKHLLDYIVAIGSIATPVFVIGLTAVGWRLRRRLERRLELEDKLREDRINIYNQILEPFIILLMTDAAWQHDKQNRGKDKNDIATAKMLSLEYRKSAFKLSLIGSDAVVSAYNDQLQHLYGQGDNPDTSEKNLASMMSLLGKFLLQIRRSMGNEATKLNHWQMLEWFMTDVRRWRDA